MKTSTHNASFLTPPVHCRISSREQIRVPVEFIHTPKAGEQGVTARAAAPEVYHQLYRPSFVSTLEDLVRHAV